MDAREREALAALVTEQVLAILRAREQAEPPKPDARRVLVVGALSQEARAAEPDAALYDLEDYRAHRDVTRYDRVWIDSLTLTQLCDIAQGRVGDAASCAVVNALLEGVETVMPERALPFRPYAGRGSAALYRVLEGYARTLRAFGVKTPAAPGGSARPGGERLITEAKAQELVRRDKTVRLPADAIVTPSAHDVFFAAGAHVILGGE